MTEPENSGLGMGRNQWDA